MSEKQQFLVKKNFVRSNISSKSSYRKMPISDFQSQFSMSRHNRIFLIFFKRKAAFKADVLSLCLKKKDYTSTFFTEAQLLHFFCKIGTDFNSKIYSQSFMKMMVHFYRQKIIGFLKPMVLKT